MKENLKIVRRLENELRGIRRRIDKEVNPDKKARMDRIYRQMSMTLTGKEM